jgi:hypothetical protein
MMEVVQLSTFWLAAGIAVAAYFIGDGMKNFKNPNAKSANPINFMEEDGIEQHKLIKESELPYFTGLSKEDASALIKDHPEIPHIIINNRAYFPREKLRKWLMEAGTR